MTTESLPADFSIRARPPRQRVLWAEWLAELKDWKQSARVALGHDADALARPELDWARECFTCGVVMLWDERFFDRNTNTFTARHFLTEARRDFGGYDVVILWHAYPRIGFDERNQYDFYRNIPGGVSGLKQLVDELHANGVRVLITYKPWDTKTRREAASDNEVLAQLVADIGADGIFLDTIDRAPPGLRQELDKIRPGIVLQSEALAPLRSASTHAMTWVQGLAELGDAQVLRNKWFEQRQMQYIVRRWHVSHTEEIHTAWLNGAGVIVWDNVFGVTRPWQALDRALLSTTHSIQREAWRFFSDGTWTPYVPTGHPALEASVWDLPGARLVTIANRSGERIDHIGELSDAPVIEWDGSSFQYTAATGWVALAGPASRDTPLGIEPFGVAARIAWSPDADTALIASAENLVANRLTPPPDTVRVPNPLRTVAARMQTQGLGSEMLLVEGGAIALTSTFTLRECGDYYPPAFDDVARPKLGTAVDRVTTVELGNYAIDREPVTLGDYRAFIDATGYRPAAGESFLRVNGEDGSQPVVGVDLEDARAFARWCGKRLPTEHEWQHAFESARPGFGRRRVWEWTESETSDSVNRYCILKGGSSEHRDGSAWYADSGPKSPRHSAKYLLFWPGADWLSTAGFRCVIDVPPSTSEDA
jgi:formylglycine-generating enzyme